MELQWTSVFKNMYCWPLCHTGARFGVSQDENSPTTEEIIVKKVSFWVHLSKSAERWGEKRKRTWLLLWVLQRTFTGYLETSRSRTAGPGRGYWPEAVLATSSTTTWRRGCMRAGPPSAFRANRKSSPALPASGIPGVFWSLLCEMAGAWYYPRVNNSDNPHTQNTTWHCAVIPSDRLTLHSTKLCAN